MQLLFNILNLECYSGSFDLRGEMAGMPPVEGGQRGHFTPEVKCPLAHREEEAYSYEYRSTEEN